MKALAIVPGRGGVHPIEIPEPEVLEPGQVKLRVLYVGICGTDREQAEGGRALPPEGKPSLIPGHEMLGEVVEVGAGVERLRPGDLAVLTVRRPCSRCTPCHLLRPDMCHTGDYVERGIWGLDGFQTEYVVDHERWMVHVPPDLKDVGVLAEPISVVEKAIDVAVRLQCAHSPGADASPNWVEGRPCLVAGLGPIGLLAAMVLRLRGAEVFGLDIVEPGSARPRWLEHIGGRYLDGREIGPTQIAQTAGPMDLVIEATGAARLIFKLLAAVAPDGIYVVTGIPGGHRTVEIPGEYLARQMVLENRLMVGSVNAGRDHFRRGIDDLALGRLRWGAHVEALITHRYLYEDAEAALSKKPVDEIKAVIDWVS